MILDAYWPILPSWMWNPVGWQMGVTIWRNLLPAFYKCVGTHIQNSTASLTRRPSFDSYQRRNLNHHVIFHLIYFCLLGHDAVLFCNERRKSCLRHQSTCVYPEDGGTILLDPRICFTRAMRSSELFLQRTVKYRTRSPRDISADTPRRLSYQRRSRVLEYSPLDALLQCFTSPDMQ
jgi:hypothetical protein